jgi:hypothetical protein
MDIRRSVNVLGNVVECSQSSDFSIQWIGKPRFLTPPDLL